MEKKHAGPRVWQLAMLRAILCFALLLGGCSKGDSAGESDSSTHSNEDQTNGDALDGEWHLVSETDRMTGSTLQRVVSQTAVGRGVLVAEMYCFNPLGDVSEAIGLEFTIFEVDVPVTPKRTGSFVAYAFEGRVRINDETVRAHYSQSHKFSNVFTWGTTDIQPIQNTIAVPEILGRGADRRMKFKPFREALFEIPTTEGDVYLTVPYEALAPLIDCPNRR